MSLKYTIQSGDTLSQIAQSMGVNMTELAKANGIEDANKIRAGRKLSMPSPPKEADKVRAVQEQMLRPKKAEVQKEKTAIQKKAAPIRSSERSEDPSLFRKAVNFFAPNDNTAENTSMLSKPTPKVAPKIEKKRNEPILPANIRQLIYDVSGGDETITEDDLKSSEIASLIKIVQNAQGRGSASIGYDDYKTTKGGSAYADVTYGGKSRTKATTTASQLDNPAFSMKTLIGQAAISKDADGNTIIIDRYNFNDAVDGSLFDYAKDVKKAGLSLYGQARAVGKHFGSKPGEGSHVVINLGKLSNV